MAQQILKEVDGSFKAFFGLLKLAKKGKYSFKDIKLPHYLPKDGYTTLVIGFVRINDNNAIIYGTAWKGKHNIGSNVSFPLKAICFLERGNNNFIEEMTLENAFPKLVCHVYQKKDEQYMIKMLKLLDKLKYVRFYSLKCNMDLQAAVVAYEKMRECNET